MVCSSPEPAGLRVRVTRTPPPAHVRICVRPATARRIAPAGRDLLNGARARPLPRRDPGVQIGDSFFEQSRGALRIGT